MVKTYFFLQRILTRCCILPFRKILIHGDPSFYGLHMYFLYPLLAFLSSKGFVQTWEVQLQITLKSRHCRGLILVLLWRYSLRRNWHLSKCLSSLSHRHTIWSNSSWFLTCTKKASNILSNTLFTTYSLLLAEIPIGATNTIVLWRVCC
jgi:hypothetical protein